MRNRTNLELITFKKRIKANTFEHGELIDFVICYNSLL